MSKQKPKFEVIDKRDQEDKVEFLNEYPLEEIEKLKIENLSLKQERLHEQAHRLEIEMSAVLQAIHYRIGLPDDYQVGIDRTITNAIVRKLEKPDDTR